MVLRDEEIVRQRSFSPRRRRPVGWHVVRAGFATAFLLQTGPLLDGAADDDEGLPMESEGGASALRCARADSR